MKHEPTEPMLIKLEEAARLLACSRRHVERLGADGRLRLLRLSPKSVRIEMDEVRRFVDACRKGEA